MSYSNGEAIADQIDATPDLTAEDCEMLILQLQELRTRLLRRAAQRLSAGDRVRLHNIKPRYLEGAPGTITGRQGTRFLVTIDPHYNTRRYGHDIRVPLAAVTPIEENA